MAVDYWPTEEGCNVEGLVIICKCTAAVAENAPAKIGTPAVGVIAVTTAAAVGDGILVGLKAGSAGDYIPCAESGLMKMIVNQTAAITAGEFVMNSAEGGIVHCVIPTLGSHKHGGGSSYVLGLAMQTSQGSKLADEIIVLLGKYM
jgi:hypothetical protein